MFQSGEPTERSRDDETAEDVRHRHKMTQENVGERRRTQGDTGHRSDETRTQDAGQDTGETQGRRSDSGTGREVIEAVS